MKAFLAAFFTLLFLFLPVCALADGPQTTTGGSLPEINGDSLPAALQRGGLAYAVLNQSTGEVLKSQNAGIRMEMASTTKVMTALVAIENAPLELVIHVPGQAVGVEGSSIYLKKGEALTLKELLYGLMLASGNDAAIAIAIGVAGSVENFVTLMNEKAQALGANNTHFVNPHGLSVRDHYTTALDLARICAYAMKNPVFAEIVGTINYRIPLEGVPDGRYLYNKNKILAQYQGGTGIKIGYTRSSGRCLCASARRGKLSLVCVVLNDGDWFRTAMKLMDNCFSLEQDGTPQSGQ